VAAQRRLVEKATAAKDAGFALKTNWSACALIGLPTVNQAKGAVRAN
jgi:hypothetical protein